MLEMIKSVIQSDARILNYRPHPKDGEGTVFTGVCLFTPGGQGVPHLHPVVLPLVPCPF